MKRCTKGLFCAKNACFFSLFCLASSKAVSGKSTQIRQKETCSLPGVTFCQTRVSSDTVPSATATGLKAGATKVCPSGGKTPPPCRGGGPQGRRGFPCTRVTFLFFRPVYVIRRCVRCCSRGRKTPSAPSGLVPLRGGTVLASAWRTEGALRPVQNLLTPH